MGVQEKGWIRALGCGATVPGLKAGMLAVIWTYSLGYCALGVSLLAVNTVLRLANVAH